MKKQVESAMFLQYQFKLHVFNPTYFDITELNVGKHVVYFLIISWKCFLKFDGNIFLVGTDLGYKLETNVVYAFSLRGFNCLCVFKNGVDAFPIKGIWEILQLQLYRTYDNSSRPSNFVQFLCCNQFSFYGVLLFPERLTKINVSRLCISFAYPLLLDPNLSNSPVTR